jgi:ferredoxin-fold anticodon binding domain-containing protein
MSAAVARQLGQAERVERAWDDVRRRCVRETVRLERPLEPVVERFAIPRVQLLAGDSLRRILRMEVERQVRDLGVVPAP